MYAEIGVSAQCLVEILVEIIIVRKQTDWDWFAGKGKNMRNSKAVKPEVMSVVDTAWLRMDSPENLMVINGFWVFEESFSRDRFVQIVQERLLAIPRFRNVPLSQKNQYFWQPVDDIDLDYHVSSVVLPKTGQADEDMKAFIAGLISEPLDAGKPLWRFYHVADYQGKSAIVFRIHHAYADGIALISVFDAIADKSVMHTSPAAHATFPEVLKAQPGMLGWLIYAVKKVGLASLFTLGWLYEAAHVALLSSDSKTTYKQPLTVNKQVAWASPLDVAEVKAVGKAIGCTVNDVLLGCVAGSLRSYLASSGESANGVTLRATVPVNLRPLSEAMNLGNHFGLVYLELPVAEPDASKRIAKVRQNMSTLKSGIQAQMTYGVLAILGRFPTKVQRFALDFFSQKASAVMTNVPGPAEAIRFDGVALTHPMFWVPQSGNIGVGVSILSYAGNVEFGLIADKALVSDPSMIVEGFVAEFQALQKRVNDGDPLLASEFLECV